MEQVDVAVVGSGVAGLTCAQVLHQAGYRVTILEKSRGVGGRLATRRLEAGRADHGTCYLSPRQALFQALIQSLVERDIVQVWTDCVYELTADGILQGPTERSPRYVAADGMSAIAKFLMPGLAIQFNQRVVQLKMTAAQTWQLKVEQTLAGEVPTVQTITAKAVVITAPAPQTLDLLTPLESWEIQPERLVKLRSVAFSPCFAVMAGYPAETLTKWQTQYGEVRAIASAHSDVGWIGLDSSKRRTAQQPVFVIQSTADFAHKHLDEADLQPVGAALLDVAARLLTPWLATPRWMQVHRWRYAIAHHPLPEPYLLLNDQIPLLCAGDWCGGMRVESAFLSGLEAAQRLNQLLENRAIASSRFWESLHSA